MASMRDIQAQKQYRQHTADHKSHEVGFHRKASEDEGKSGRMQTVF